MIFKKTITVNDLNEIIRKHYKAKECFILRIETASIMNQHKPEKFEIGAGGELNITFECSRKIR